MAVGACVCSVRGSHALERILSHPPHDCTVLARGAALPFSRLPLACLWSPCLSNAFRTTHAMAAAGIFLKLDDRIQKGDPVLGTLHIAKKQLKKTVKEQVERFKTSSKGSGSRQSSATSGQEG